MPDMIKKTLGEMQGYLAELPNATKARCREIYEEASTCAQLMDYSDLVVDHSNPDWRELNNVVSELMSRTSEV